MDQTNGNSRKKIPDSYMLKDLANIQIVNRVYAKYIKKFLVQFSNYLNLVQFSIRIEFNINN